MIRILLAGRLAEAIQTTSYEVETSGPTTMKMVVLDLVRKHPELCPYIWNDTALPRGDVAFYVDSVPVSDPSGLSDVLRSTCTIHILQSSGPPVGMCWSTDWRERRSSRRSTTSPQYAEPPITRLL
ncbi:MAG TPA: hypothetical protein VGQ10_18850 [Vicinamibacterales bacterium]|jgi:hypothetical protein|nr:hypothetical protein [Vicinamibacterales bacterium]